MLYDCRHFILPTQNAIIYGLNINSHLKVVFGDEAIQTDSYIMQNLPSLFLRFLFLNEMKAKAKRELSSLKCNYQTFKINFQAQLWQTNFRPLCQNALRELLSKMVIFRKFFLFVNSNKSSYLYFLKFSNHWEYFSTSKFEIFFDEFTARL